MPMPGKAMVAATEAMLMMLPPLPAGPPGRMDRRPCLMPSAVPRKLTSSILRTWWAWISVNRLVISMPALLTRMSRPPRCSTASPIACSQPHARRQLRRAPDPAGDLGPGHARRARLRQDVAARDRPELRVLPRGRALLLRRQVRADHPLRALLQGAVRHEVRQPGRRV